jgi:tetratricopeptide (TPR) repeat protein
VDEREAELRNKKGKEMSQSPRSLTELFSQYLHRQITAQAEGSGLADPDGQAVPYEAVSMQPVDPRLAWENALAVIGTTEIRNANEGEPLSAPPDWPTLVAAQEPAIALAFCIGNYPQMVRNLQPLLAGADLATLRRVTARPGNVSPAFLHWANAMRGYPQLFLAAGVLRLARRFEEASDILGSNSETPAAWQALRANEEAALAWHRGNAEEALASWQAQKTTVPVLFNRGMAALFLGSASEARTALRQSVAQLPDTSAWHHLGHLYLALIAARS